MTAIASHVTAFFEQRLTLERHASVNTCDSYAYAFKMLLDYASKRLRTPPSKLQLEQVDAPLQRVPPGVNRDSQSPSEVRV